MSVQEQHINLNFLFKCAHVCFSHVYFRYPGLKDQPKSKECSLTWKWFSLLIICQRQMNLYGSYMQHKGVLRLQKKQLVFKSASAQSESNRIYKPRMYLNNGTFCKPNLIWLLLLCLIVLHKPDSAMHRLGSNLSGAFVSQEAVFPPFKELKLCLNDINSHQKHAFLSFSQTNDPTFPDWVSDWETESQPVINAAERSHWIRNGAAVQWFVTYYPLDCWQMGGLESKV